MIEAKKVTAPVRDRAQTACLESYIIDAPGQSPAWHQYHVGLIHLRPLAGVKPPVLNYPAAQYEIILSALSPDRRAVPEDMETIVHLRPANHTYQFHGVTDEQACEILRTLVYMVTRGQLPAEPLLSTGGGADRQWQAVTEALLAQYCN